MLQLQSIPEAVDQQVQQTPPERPHGILTILLLKNKNADASSEEKSPPQEEQPGQPKLILFRLKNVFGQSDESASDSSSTGNNEDNTGMLNPFALFDRMRQHMLQQQQLFEEEFNNGQQPSEQDSLDARHDALIRRLHLQEASGEPPKRKCVMLSFLRWRTSVYYRTAIHLLFFSGLVLFALLLAMLVTRTCRQRRAAQRMRQLSSVSTITGGSEKQPPPTGASAPGFYIFRLGSLKSTDPTNGGAMKQAEAEGAGVSSALITAGPLPPPAYERVIGSGETASAVRFAGRRQHARAMVNSLVQAFKTRYATTYNPISGGGRRQSADNASLPAYDELEKK